MLIGTSATTRDSTRLNGMQTQVAGSLGIKDSMMRETRLVPPACCFPRLSRLASCFVRCLLGPGGRWALNGGVGDGSKHLQIGPNSTSTMLPSFHSRDALSLVDPTPPPTRVACGGSRKHQII